jgi:RNA polymerase sigma-70 factor (ECF subfamily)
MPSRTNEAWLRALRQTGEAQEEALEALRDYLLRAILVYLRHHRSDLAGYSRDEVRRLAEDMAQDALLLTQASLDTYRGDAKFTTWAYSLAINLAAGELRLQRYRNLSLDELQDDEPAVFSELLRSQPSLDPRREAERRELARELRRIIRDDLTERQRLAILGVHFRRASMDEMAELLEMKRNAFYKLLHDARRKIKAGLQARHFSEGDIVALFDDDR